jgi:biotin carboxyl carrier protein
VDGIVKEFYVMEGDYVEIDTPLIEVEVKES